METSNEMGRQPEAASPPEEGGAGEVQIRSNRNEIDFGSRTVERSIGHEWPRVYSLGGNGFIESGPGHGDMI